MREELISVDLKVSKGGKTPYQGNEKEIMEHLANAWNLFLKMESTHPSHKSDFVDGIHKCQDIIIHRIVQRDYPHEFPRYKEEK